MIRNLNIVWFRKDLRLKDNPALEAAAHNADIFPIYINDTKDKNERNMGAASKVWLYNSLNALNSSIGNKLNYFRGNAENILIDLIQNNRINGVYWNRCYEPFSISRDTKIKKILLDNNVKAESFNGSLIREPWEVLKDDNTPYKVFTPFFKKAYLTLDNIDIEDFDTSRINYVSNSSHNNINNLNLLTNLSWENEVISSWKVGEKAAIQKAEKFFRKGILEYKEGRNFPAKNNVSRLSPHLHFGEISPKRLWVDTCNLKQNKNTTHFLSELCWREFSYYLLYHFPYLPEKNLQIKFDSFPWVDNNDYFEKWKKGETGYPIIDAGMKELYSTGYMHNRVRMIVASFLVKNLLIHWRKGENYFWDCLFDADLANNSAGWQWVAGSGTDAAPYFRIFNPVAQGKRFDCDGSYTRKYLPALKNMPDEYLFNPWEAPELVLKEADVSLGKNYPKPIVDIKLSRENALHAYEKIK
ncbi:MAG: deoxyribodipyrimidine photolyase [Pelagibacterales bacterium]|nr:deoxyribodipyrimidine photolyase [Pelagibacterales bacterium]|tara:strand:+ start:4227 stop:5636 length:1410 start_codon:yes stop_codon:yes gene_type:complete